MRPPKYSINQYAQDLHSKQDIGIISEIRIHTQPGYSDKSQIVVIIEYKLVGMERRHRWVNESDLLILEPAIY